MVFCNSRWQDCPDTDRSVVAYIVFYQGGTTDHFTHVPGSVSQYSAESEYNSEFTTGMALAHFGMINNELLN